MSKFSKGRWWVDGQNICSDTKDIIAVMEPGRGWKSNAQLIASAPDLLEALKKISDPNHCGCRPCMGRCSSDADIRIQHEEMCEIAKAAIAKVGVE